MFPAKHQDLYSQVIPFISTQNKVALLDMLKDLKKHIKKLEKEIGVAIASTKRPYKKRGRKPGKYKLMELAGTGKGVYGPTKNTYSDGAPVKKKYKTKRK